MRRASGSRSGDDARGRGTGLVGRIGVERRCRVSQARHWHPGHPGGVRPVRPWPLVRAPTKTSPARQGEQTDPGVFGSGVGVTLPDGSTATAPNAVAASAVRHALTQLGVPYRLGRHHARRRIGLQRSDPVGVSRSGPGSSATGPGAGRRRGGQPWLAAAGRPGSVGRPRRDDRRGRFDDRGGRSGEAVADSNRPTRDRVFRASGGRRREVAATLSPRPTSCASNQSDVAIAPWSPHERTIVVARVLDVLDEEDFAQPIGGAPAVVARR